jgi:hypothetical protein
MARKRHEAEMVERLSAAAADRLTSVVSYGPAVHGDDYARLPAAYLLIVLTDLELGTLQLLSDPVHWWSKKGESSPRVFTVELLHASADVYPIELLELLQHRRVLFGTDPVAGLVVDRSHLRMQCERELREKLMRLREGYIEGHGHRGARDQLFDLIAVSYASFVRIFRACLSLLDAPLAQHDRDVVDALCTWLDQTPEPFHAAERIARGDQRGDPEPTFAAYYQALTVIETRIDRMIINPSGRAP